VILLSDRAIPSRLAYLDDAGPSPVPALTDVIRSLESLGAEVIALPSITTHAHVAELRETVTTPIVGSAGRFDRRRTGPADRLHRHLASCPAAAHGPSSMSPGSTRRPCSTPPGSKTGRAPRDEHLADRLHARDGLLRRLGGHGRRGRGARSGIGFYDGFIGPGTGVVLIFARIGQRWISSAERQVEWVVHHTARCTRFSLPREDRRSLMGTTKLTGEAPGLASSLRLETRNQIIFRRRAAQRAWRAARESADRAALHLHKMPAGHIARVAARDSFERARLAERAARDSYQRVAEETGTLLGRLARASA
jgi:hypothetical protein